MKDKVKIAAIKIVKFNNGDDTIGKTIVFEVVLAEYKSTTFSLSSRSMRT